MPSNSVPRLRKILTFGCALLLLAAPLLAAKLEDILRPDRLAKHLKTRPDQKEMIAVSVQALRDTIANYQWERGKRICEAAIWQGYAPDIEQLRDMRKDARKHVDAILDTLKTGLDAEQVERLDKLLKDEENILDLTVRDIPFEHINNTPLFGGFENSTDAYRVTLPAPDVPEAPGAWPYGALLKTWTVRSYIPSQRPVDAAQQDATGIADHTNLQVRSLADPLQRRAVNSPLLLAATLFTPDLARVEFDLLWENYPHKHENREDAWAHYRQQNRLDDAILVRLKMSTPYALAYLDLDRWIVYLEDAEGIGYEPIEMRQESVSPIPALKISLPGREVEVTDVFGEYYPYIPGNKETFYLEAPARITYSGNEKLLKLFFPVKDFQGRPIINPKTQRIKLIVQSQETDFGRAELEWELKRNKPDKPPKG